MLHLVRHGRPLMVPGMPAANWDLDPTSYDDVWTLRASGRLPARAVWLASPEPKAMQTAGLLTDGEVGVVRDLREHERSGEWVEDFPASVRRAFAEPDVPGVNGWEPVIACRERVTRAVRHILTEYDGEVVLVGHGTAWTLVVADLTGQPPDVDRWAVLAMPDVITVDV